MLNAERVESDEAKLELPLTYARYLRVPELTSLQTPLAEPAAHDEMLFIIVQQAQELWFKQILWELEQVIAELAERKIDNAVRLLSRVNRIVEVAGREVAVLESMLPGDFHQFRHVLSSSSGLESVQFRELEFASGLGDPSFVKLMAKLVEHDGIRSRWPQTLRDAMLLILRDFGKDPVAGLVRIYNNPNENREVVALAEALSEYDLQFALWRFQHVKLVERTIGDRVPGTAGSTGAGYLVRTLGYRFFPELWAARNVLTSLSN